MCIGLNIDIAMASYVVSKIFEQQISKPRSHSPVIFVRDSTAKKSRRVHSGGLPFRPDVLRAPTSSFHTFISSVFTS